MRRENRRAALAAKVDFGRWLKAARSRAGLSQTDAAQRAGMTRHQWGRIEGGVSGTRRETVGRLAKAVGADPVQGYVLSGFIPPGKGRVAEDTSETYLALAERLRVLLITCTDDCEFLVEALRIKQRYDRDRSAGASPSRSHNRNNNTSNTRRGGREK